MLNIRKNTRNSWRDFFILERNKL